MVKLGYTQEEGDGSRVKFDNGNATDLINLHKPHPGNEVKAYVIRQVREKLTTGGML
ncbi:type II toxin-antitoxin system HicA family toxin [Thiothrix lacustris]|uniref:Type II toxin-antitoxin system HicA family toxin n=1 Tax=Thiothrix lacustris TaxID=525917 RepID=A0ABY9MK76_9GAMM|nr:type II toxin-antitoxin system HicA family toxin [Thiothrix lacustris]WML89080.1 type II toxin-antitoxin system HicA family toxin [Thiothrix lacustris]